MTPWTVAHQAPLSMGFSRQEYWSGLPCPPPGDLPDPGIKPRSPALQADSLSCEQQGSSQGSISLCNKKKMREFPGGPAVRTLCFQLLRAWVLMPGVRTKIPQAAQDGQIKKRKKTGCREEKLFHVQGKPFKKKKQHTVLMFK